jgi:hypothetical protein
MLAGLVAGCAGLELDSKCPCVTEAKAEAGREKAPDLSRQRLILSEGYSLLYADAAHLDLSELILYVKIESDEFHEIVTAIAEFGGELKDELERIHRDYPGVRIDPDPLLSKPTPPYLTRNGKRTRRTASSPPSVGTTPSFTEDPVSWS